MKWNEICCLMCLYFFHLKRNSKNYAGGWGVFPMRLMFFSNLRVLLLLLYKFLANIAFYYAILTILQVYISSFTQF